MADERNTPFNQVFPKLVQLTTEGLLETADGGSGPQDLLDDKASLSMGSNENGRWVKMYMTPTTGLLLVSNVVVLDSLSENGLALQYFWTPPVQISTTLSISLTALDYRAGGGGNVHPAQTPLAVYSRDIDVDEGVLRIRVANASGGTFSEGDEVPVSVLVVGLFDDS